MVKNLGPDNNRYKDMQEKLNDSEKVEELDAEIEEDDSEDIEAEIKKNEKLAKKQFRDRLVKMMFVIVIVVVIILVIGFIVSLVSKKDYTYTEVENILTSAAKSYFSDHKSKLPATTSQKVEISDTVLTAGEYMKPMSDYISSDTCSGKVLVQKSDEEGYDYIAYLDCGENYQTIELYKKIVDNKNIVTDGYGLYALNDGYAYRGKEVDNYVKFSDSDLLWRIIKINSSNEITLISDDTTENSFTWDDRYNNLSEENSGINKYKNSEISIFIDKIYHNKLNDDSDDSYYFTEETFTFSKKTKAKMLTFKACVGNRSTSDTTRDGSVECSEVVDTKVSLLPVYDFINASLDPNCTTAIAPDCQNYNYLSINNRSSYWLANGVTEDTYHVYGVDESGYIDKHYANKEKRLKLVIHLGDDVMVESGKGTKKNPYIIR